MKNIDLQFISDTILVERVAALEFGLVKQAGLFDSLNLGGIADSIKSFVSGHVSDDAPGGYVGSVLALMAPSVLWRINPFVGILYLVASQFGFDIQSAVSKIVEMLKPKLEKGLSVTADEINEIGKSVIAQHIGGTSTAAPDDFFEPLRKLSNADLNKLAAGGGGGSLVQRIFGQLFSAPKTAGKGKWLLGGFIIWLIKTVLVGAGLLAGAEAISGALGHKKPGSDKPVAPSSKPEETSGTGSTYPQKQETVPSKITSAPVSSQELWVVPLVGDGTVEDTLIAWALDLYPNLSHYDNIEQIIKSTPSFTATAALLKKDPRKIGSRTLVMPADLSSRKQVVSFFIDDVIRNLK